jgi:hypothetical protein
MRKRMKQWAMLLALAAPLSLLLLPGLPWSARVGHALNRSIVNARMRLARWRGVEPRLVSIIGRINAAGASVHALDSRSGWASLTDKEGHFLIRDVMWYPNATYDLAVTEHEVASSVFTIRGPEAVPENATFDAGELDSGGGLKTTLARLIGINSTTEDDFDFANVEYYKTLFEKLTAHKQSDDEKMTALCEFVAGRLNYSETSREMVSPRRVLERGSQFCGHLECAMRTVASAGGYRARGVHIIDGRQPPGTHAVVEVFYSGGWHLYDPTYGVKFVRSRGEVASYRDVRLDQSLISEELFLKLDRRSRRDALELLRGAYATGCYHLYQFKSTP